MLNSGVALEQRDLQGYANRLLARAAHYSGVETGALTEPRPQGSGAFSPIQRNFERTTQIVTPWNCFHNAPPATGRP